MTYDVGIHDDSTTHEDEHPARKAVPQRILGGVGLAVIALACGWTLYTNLAADRGDAVLVAPPVVLTVQKPAPSPTFHIDRVLLDPARPVGFTPRTFAQSVPLTSRFQFAARAPAQTDIAAPSASQPAAIRSVQSVPLPTPRPAELALTQAQKPSKFTLASAASTPFEKLFGKPENAGPALAYAAPDGGVLNDGQSVTSGRMPANDGMTAIYDITARTVYMPDGTKLEAHSGLGTKMDDPRHVHVRMHGATPPHVYDLSPREALFHGVEALRMHPVGGPEAIFGRTGLLTHSYLLGPNGDSNGCVSFKDYAAFLQAYKDGKVKRLIVVASVDDPQLDLRVAERRTPKYARTYALSSFGATSSQPQDDRYALPAFSSSLASRTSSSARSLN